MSFNNDYMKADTLLDIISGEKISVTKKKNSKERLLPANNWRFKVLVEER